MLGGGGHPDPHSYRVRPTFRKASSEPRRGKRTGPKLGKHIGCVIQVRGRKVQMLSTSHEGKIYVPVFTVLLRSHANGERKVSKWG